MITKHLKNLVLLWHKPQNSLGSTKYSWVMERIIRLSEKLLRTDVHMNKAYSLGVPCKPYLQKALSHIMLL